MVRARWAASTFPAIVRSPKSHPTLTTETYVALKLAIENWRWAGVPFYLRTGKHLPKRTTEIAIEFNLPPLLLLGRDGGNQIEPNVLAFNIQPDEGISLKIESKIPGQDNRIRPVNMDFRYGSSFGMPTPEAYERLLLDAMLGDPMLFTREDRSRSPMERHHAYPECMEPIAAAALSELRSRHLGTRRSGLFHPA